MPGRHTHLSFIFIGQFGYFFLLMETEKNITIKFNYYLFSNKLVEKCFTNSLKQKNRFILICGGIKSFIFI